MPPVGSSRPSTHSKRTFSVSPVESPYASVTNSSPIFATRSRLLEDASSLPTNSRRKKKNARIAPVSDSPTSTRRSFAGRQSVSRTGS